MTYYIMSAIGRPNNQLICKEWEEVYKPIYASSHFRCGIKKFKEKLNFFNQLICKGWKEV